MQDADRYYPAEACPFCAIAEAYPEPEPALGGKGSGSGKGGLWTSKKEKVEGEGDREGRLGDAVPREEECGEEKTSPRSFVVLRSKGVVAFLDILPMTGGELTVFFLWGWGEEGGGERKGCGEGMGKGCGVVCLNAWNADIWCRAFAGYHEES